ncbi:DNA-processing protein DprA [Aquirufa sp. ROCK-SH2]
MPPTDQNKILQIALTLIPQLGDIRARRLISYVGSAEAIFQSNAKYLEKIPNISRTISQEIHHKSYRILAEEIYLNCQKNGVDVNFYLDDSYPSRLKYLYDSPLLLYSKGVNELNHAKMLAVVGTRKATEYGKKVTKELVLQSKVQNVVFVSGLAYGIDISMHQYCIENNIPNIAVLAGGFDFIYPYEHKKYIDKIMDLGALISEHPIHEKPDSRYFPLRNRIIAGMTDATIVVEAAKKGGALITAEYANNYHREVFAVPGNLDKTFSEGCNQLIAKHQANIYTNWESLAQHLNWSQTTSANQTKLMEFNYDRFTELESTILSQLRQNGELPLDELAWKVQKSVSEIAFIMLNLEFQGVIKAIPGHRYKLN